jgi:hypothetical protein
MQALEFGLSRVDVRGSVLADLKKRLDPHPHETEWMLRFHEPALVDGVSKPWRAWVGQQAKAKVGYMTNHVVATAMAWSR